MPFNGNPDLVDDHVKQNYAELHAQGRSWESMADTAEKSNDPHLAAHLRKQAAEDTQTERSAAPVNRTAAPAKQTGAKR